MIDKVLSSSARVIFAIAAIYVATVAIWFSSTSGAVRANAGMYLVNGSKLQVIDKLAINMYANFYDNLSFFVTLSAIVLVAVLVAVKWLADRQGVLWHALLAILCIFAMSPSTTIMLAKGMVDIQNDQSWSSLFPGVADAPGEGSADRADIAVPDAFDTALGNNNGASLLEHLLTFSAEMATLGGTVLPVEFIDEVAGPVAMVLDVLVNIAFLILLVVPTAIALLGAWRWIRRPWYYRPSSIRS